MQKQENNTIEERFLKNLFSFIKENTNKEDKFVLAISGGSDSMVLLDLFQVFSKKYPITFCVANVDHRIRKESSEEQLWLKKLCEEQKMPFYAESVDIIKMKRNLGAKTSLEELARDERQKMLKKIKKDYNAQWVITAHHQDDLLETFFLRLIRGTGLNGINTMNSVDGFYLRPLLSYSKEEIVAYSKEKGLFYFNDQTNDDTRFLRNKIRHRLIPYFTNEFGNEVKDVLIRDIENLKNADRALSELINKVLLKAKYSSNKVEIHQKHLQDKSPSYLRELFIRMYQKWHGSPAGLTKKKVEDICLKFLKEGDFEITISHAIRFLRSNDIVGFDKNVHYLQKSKKQQILLGEDFKKELEKKNILTLDIDLLVQRGSVCFQLLSFGNNIAFGKTLVNKCAYLDYEKIKFPLIIRFWKGGDRIKPIGMENFKRVSRLMTDARIKKYAKRKQLIMENGKHDIIWCMGLRISEDYKITSSTVRYLKVIYLDSSNKDLEGRER
ncbi:MAG: tRNA lysidine(34) synthetase TilS [Thermotogota bacterium]|nr:tRNA lysidine(34) synthetase TilS [Thermotogota bacterium]